MQIISDMQIPNIRNTNNEGNFCCPFNGIESTIHYLLNNKETEKETEKQLQWHLQQLVSSSKYVYYSVVLNSFSKMSEVRTSMYKVQHNEATTALLGVDSIDWCIEQRKASNLTAISVLSSFLFSNDDQLVMVAADTLARYGDKASGSEDQLIKLVQDEKRSMAVRDTAAYCLGCVSSRIALGVLKSLETQQNNLGKCAKQAIDKIEKRYP